MLLSHSKLGKLKKRFRRNVSEETFQKNLSKESSGPDEVDIDPTFKK
jgi:hypothetical protein